MSWHVDASDIHRYQEAALDRVAAASLEAHLTDCGECRSLVVVDRDWLERSWSTIAELVEPSRPGVVERTLTRLGVPSHVARIVAVSPALRISFLLAVVLVMAFAAVASTSNPTDGTYRVFLIVAPLLPVAGVAFAYGRLVDPAYDLTLASPIDSFRLLLLRVVTVLAVSIPVGLVAWPMVPAPSAFGFTAWLLPALALTLVTLALSSRFEVWLAGSMVGGGWVAAMVIAVAEGYETFDTRAQIGYAVLALLAAVAVMVRRERYDREGTPR